MPENSSEYSIPKKILAMTPAKSHKTNLLIETDKDIHYVDKTNYSEIEWKPDNIFSKT